MDVLLNFTDHIQYSAKKMVIYEQVYLSLGCVSPKPDVFDIR